MSVNQIVVIADKTNLAKHFYFNTEFFLKFTLNGSVQIFSRFYATARSFNKSYLTKIIISICPEK